MAIELRKTGISVVGDMPWGTHFCQFFETKEDLLDILIPYFKTGLQNNELCVWIVADPLSEAEAKNALKQALPEVDQYLAAGRIEIVPHASLLYPSGQETSSADPIEIIPHTEWYLKEGVFDLERVMNGWNEKLSEALARGYAGMRVNGNEAWLTKEDWQIFSQYEKKLNELIINQRMIVLCSYPLATSGAAEIFDVAHTHQFAIARRKGDWQVLETPELKQAKAEINRLNEGLEQRVIARTKDLATAIDGLRREIIERKRVEQELRESEAQLAEAQQLAQLGSWSRELATNVVAWSDEIFRIFGMEPQKSGTTYRAFLEKVHPDNRMAVRAVIEDAFKYHRPFSCEYRIIRLDGAVRIVHERGSVVVDDSGKPVRVFGAVQDITERKLAEQELRASRAQLRGLATYLQTVRELERKHIARELHDEIGEGLTGIKLALERSGSGQPADATEELARALALANELIGRVRDLSLELRPTMLDDLGLMAALRWHFDRYTDQFKIAVDFKHSGLSDRRFAPETETAVYRIIQEALTNVARHAQIDKVAVQIDVDEDLLRVQITDEGVGFDPDSLPAERAGGLTGMRERAIMLGGRLWLVSSAGLGTVLRAEIPLHKPVSTDEC